MLVTNEKPVPDGKLVIVLRRDTALRLPEYAAPRDYPLLLTTTDATASVREYGIGEAKWQAFFWGLEVTRNSEHADGYGKDLFPFTNVISFTILPNSDKYEAALLKYIRSCDHEWITHPSIAPPLTYCETCRVDMSDLATVMDPKTTEPPALVVESTDLDRMSHAFDGKDPHVSATEEQSSGGPAHLVISVDEIPEDIHRLVDGQLGGEADAAVDDPDTTEF